MLQAQYTALVGRIWSADWGAEVPLFDVGRIGAALSRGYSMTRSVSCPRRLPGRVGEAYTGGVQQRVLELIRAALTNLKVMAE